MESSSKHAFTNSATMRTKTLLMFQELLYDTLALTHTRTVSAPRQCDDLLGAEPVPDTSQVLALLRLDAVGVEVAHCGD